MKTPINYNNDNLKKISKDGVNYVKSGENFKNNKESGPDEGTPDFLKWLDEVNLYALLCFYTEC